MLEGVYMNIVVFSSGSEGNCTLVKAQGSNILIDAGISRKQIELNLEKSGVKIDEIDGLLITHEHIDHIKGLAMLLKLEGLNIYLSRGTFNAIYSIYKTSGKDKQCGLLEEKYKGGKIHLIDRIKDSILYPEIKVKDTLIDVLPTFHDAAESIGFVVHEDEKKLVYITDTGYVHQSLYPFINNADIYVLESNHDPEILMHSSRPYPLKIRILSDHGHMSNEDSMVTLANVIGPRTKLIMHAHISQECNLTRIIELTREKVFRDYGLATDNIKFVILAPRPSGEFSV